MNDKKNKGYKLPENLVEVMDLASLLNAKMNTLPNYEKARLLKDGFSTKEEADDEVHDLFIAQDHIGQAIYALGDYVGSLVKMEMYDKNKE